MLLSGCGGAIAWVGGSLCGKSLPLSSNSASLPLLNDVARTGTRVSLLSSVSESSSDEGSFPPLLYSFWAASRTLNAISRPCVVRANLFGVPLL